jgi:hypothetical protein
MLESTHGNFTEKINKLPSGIFVVMKMNKFDRKWMRVQLAFVKMDTIQMCHCAIHVLVKNELIGLTFCTLLKSKIGIAFTSLQKPNLSTYTIPICPKLVQVFQ